MNAIQIPRVRTNASLATWVDEMARLCKPTRVEWVDGSEAEYERLCDRWSSRAPSSVSTRKSGPTPFSRGRIPPMSVGSRTAPSSAATARRMPGRPTTGRRRPRCAPRWTKVFDGCMRGRTMYVIPFSMGPLGSPIANIGVQITDSPYVVVNMRIMTRMGTAVLDVLGDGPFIPCMHSVGAPLEPGQADVPWPCEPDISTNTSSISRRPTRSGPTARAMAAMRCSARSASRCASPR